jgi:hypothetical protein
MTRTATCSCGQLTVTCAGEPVRVVACHCLACQKQTGSAFNVAAFFVSGAVAPTGREETHRRASDAGYEVSLHFCPGCGSTLWWQSARAPELIAVAVGAFADPSFSAPAREVWTEHRHSWVTLSTDQFQ